MNRHAQHMQQF